MATQLSFLGFAWNNLWRRRLRTFLTLCGIGLAIGAFVALVGFSRSFESEWLRLYSASGTDIAVVEQNFLNTSVEQSLLPSVRALPVVEQAEPIIFNLMNITPEVNAIIFGWVEDTYEFKSLTFTSGGRFHAGKPEVILGDVVARNLQKKVGDTLELQGGNFTVVGVFQGGTALEAGAVIMPLDQMQILSNLQGKISGIHVRLKPTPANESHEQYVHRAQKEIEKAVPGLDAQLATERASNNQFVDLAHAVSWGTSAIALLMGILGIANTMAMSVFERTREIGILRAIGWKAWRVLLLIQTEALVLGVAGGVVGILVGWAILHCLALLPQTNFLVTTTLTLMHLVQAMLISTASGLIAGAYPAWRGAHLSPVEAIRHD